MAQDSPRYWLQAEGPSPATSSFKYDSYRTRDERDAELDILHVYEQATGYRLHVETWEA